MIFQNPWAWLGLLGIAVPIAAHLLSRRPAHRQLFPHLRFLPAATLKPIRRDRVTDVALLVLRCAIVAAATMALTQPLFLTDARARDLGSQIARAVIVDASASMSRAATGGGTAIDAARREAAAAAAAATVARVGETPAPADLLAASVAWLTTQPMRRELVIVSDFQPTALVRGDLTQVPAEIGVRLVRVGSDPGVRPGGQTPGSDPIQLLAGAAERAGAEAARAAFCTAWVGPDLHRSVEIRPDPPCAKPVGNGVRPRGLTPGSDPTAIAIVFPGFENRAALLAAARPIDAPWMFDVLVRVREDRVFQAAVERAGQTPAAVVTAVTGPVDGTKRLLLVTTAPAHSLMSAALIGAASRAIDASAPASELTDDVRAADELRSWERPPAAVAPTASQPLRDQSDGRWWWIAVVALLLGETIIRRSRPVEAAPEVPHARVA